MREVNRHLFIPRRPLIASVLSSDLDNSRSHEFQRGTLVPPALDQHIKHFALGKTMRPAILR
jgi:hypothetical protein